MSGAPSVEERGGIVVGALRTAVADALQRRAIHQTPMPLREAVNHAAAQMHQAGELCVAALLDELVQVTA